MQAKSTARAVQTPSRLKPYSLFKKRESYHTAWSVSLFVEGNSKEKPALCEQQSLLAANEEKEWGLFERCSYAMVFLREKRVRTFPNLPR